VDGFGTALKPAFEPIIVARKPLDGTVIQNVQKWGTGAISVDGCRIGNDAVQINVKNGWQGFGNVGDKPGYEPKQVRGRFPANVIHDGSDEVLAEFPETCESTAHARGKMNSGCLGGTADTGPTPKDGTESIRGIVDSGSAARFFYTAKAARNERWFFCSDCAAAYPPDQRPDHLHGHYQPDGKEDWRHIVRHPTQKPEDLMRYLCRLVTPPGGLVLDPFMGSGSTGKAAIIEGFRFIGIELDPVYGEIARARIERELTQGVLA